MKRYARIIGPPNSVCPVVDRNGPLDKSPIDYNKNGAMKYNFYNGIAGIAYNVLNLPEKIRFMSGHGIQYSYDASGTKVSGDIGVSVSATVVDGFVRTSYIKPYKLK